ncbi:MAG TPA: glycosyltransferase family 4 protein [Syntrophobacter fumaroxidans]|nr:glycosyltransferase family 4 protein [Syntrophobacter fumaroxidans]
MPPRIAFVRYKYTAFGGAERFTDMLVESMAGRGVEVHLYARKWKKTPGNGVVFHRVGGPSRPALLGQAGFVFAVHRKLARGRFDLVHSNERILSADVYRAGDGVHARWLELRRSRQNVLRRLIVLLNPHHVFRLWLERRLLEHPALKAVIVNSTMVREEILARFRIDPSRVHTIYNGVDLERFHPENRRSIGVEPRRLRALAEDTPVVLTVGSGFERKGLEPLLRGMAAAGGNAELWVVGKGRSDRYADIARRLGIADRVVFWGPREDTAAFYAGADIFALPALYDPFPTVILEAMASGLPVITTAQCGAAEIISNGREGFVLRSPDEVATLADHLRQLYSAPFRAAMSERARVAAEAFPVERTMRELEALYTGILGSGRESCPGQ